MNYSISEAAKRMNTTPYTLRYYEKEGLLPFIDRNANGIREFKESDFEWLALIECLKGTGMPIKEIGEFISWCMEGDSTLQKRLDMFLKQKDELERKMAELQKYLNKIDYKIWYYSTAVEAGTESIHKKSCVPVNNNSNETLDMEEIPA
jgi:DNA-binding transcriptional MerR regulator